MREMTQHRLAFHCLVRLQSPRSLTSLHAELLRGAAGAARVPGLRTLERWSAAFHWQDRLADLEREARQRDAQAHVVALREMNERHAREGIALQQKALQRFGTLGPEDMTPADAIRAAVEGARLERLARGEVTDRTALERRDDLDLSEFSIAELRALAALATSRAGGDSPAHPE